MQVAEGKQPQKARSAQDERITRSMARHCGQVQQSWLSVVAVGIRTDRSRQVSDTICKEETNKGNTYDMA